MIDYPSIFYRLCIDWIDWLFDDYLPFLRYLVNSDKSSRQSIEYFAAIFDLPNYIQWNVRAHALTLKLDLIFGPGGIAEFRLGKFQYGYMKKTWTGLNVRKVNKNLTRPTRDLYFEGESVGRRNDKLLIDIQSINNRQPIDENTNRLSYESIV